MDSEGQGWRGMERDGQEWRGIEMGGDGWRRMDTDEIDGEGWRDVVRDGVGWRGMVRDGERLKILHILVYLLFSTPMKSTDWLSYQCYLALKSLW